MTPAEVKSFEAIQAKAENGDASAQNTLGEYFYDGIGTKQDIPTGLAWWLKAANHGNAIAQRHLAVSYLGGHGTQKT